MKDQSPNPNLDYYHLPLAPNQHVVIEQESPDPIPEANLRDAQRTKKSEQSLRHAFSRVAFSVVIMLVVWISLNTAIGVVAGIIYPPLLKNIAFLLLSSSLPLILIAIPISYLIVRSMPTITPERKAPLGGAKFTLLVFIAMGIMVVGGIVSNVAMSIFSAIIGKPLTNSLNIILDAPIWAILLCTVILAPIFEELLCRKILLTRLLPYGEVPAIVLSSLLFAFIHNNLFQFLYAFGVGALFAILYLRTGRLRYCMLLHIVVNALGSLVSVLILSGISEEFMTLVQSEQFLSFSQELSQLLSEYGTLPAEEFLSRYAAVLGSIDGNSIAIFFEGFASYALLMLYSGLQYAAAAAGIILLMVFFKKIRVVKKEGDLPASRALTLFLSSAGGIVLLIVGVLLTLLNMGVFNP